MARKMKNSGIEWIGEIPFDWEITTIKRIFTLFAGATPKSEIPENWDGDIVWITPADYKTIDKYVSQGKRNISEMGLSSCSATLIPCNSIIFSKRAPIGSVVINSVPLCTNQGCISNVPKNGVNAIFYYYVMSIYTEQFELYSAGTTFKEISANNFGNFKIVFPPFYEQQKIANYLDKKCAEIDSLSSNIQSQISILEDYKKSVIIEAVTKGLNPDVKMKDSGIEWIGEVPNHWIIDRIKNHLKRNEPKNPGNMMVLSVYREYGVIPKDSRNDNHNVTSEDTSKYKYVKEGNLVINKMKAWQGSLAVSQYEGIVSPAYFIYEFTDKNLDKRYFHHLIRGCYKDEFRRVSGGIREGQWDLSSEEFSKTLILLPPIEEQKRIADYIDKKYAEIEGIIVEKKKQLGVLEQYKKSLIYEYVTGKR